MRFDLLSLKLFVAVCECKSISRAAAREHIAASAVSKRISDLEEIVKAPLFHRTTKGLEPTASAQALLRHTRVVMRDLLQMEYELAEHATGVCGRVRIHASVSTILQHLPKDLAHFLAQHSAIRIDLEEGTSQQIVRSVAENAADIGIFGGYLPAAGLQVLPYRSDKLVSIMPVGHPLASRRKVKFAELAEFDLVGPQKSSFLDSLVMRAAAELNIALKMRIRVNGFETVCSMVEANLGVGLVPERCAKRYIATGQLTSVPLDESWATRHWKICVRDSSSQPPPVRMLVQHLSSKTDDDPSRVVSFADAESRSRQTGPRLLPTNADVPAAVTPPRVPPP
jgi:DNA-binding transcriptional LysR family regulator